MNNNENDNKMNDNNDEKDTSNKNKVIITRCVKEIM